MSDKVHHRPRSWSNSELKKFAPYFSGDIINVSAWRDSDKEGKHYRDYFVNASSYTLTNFDTDKRGFQGGDGEIFLDLEQPLPKYMEGKFDVVFNHTTLEHVYDFRTAFTNICKMSRDVVIVVVPFVQQMHANYGDFWRFTPQAVDRMFRDEGLKTAYLSFNNDFRTSVYVLCIASKMPEKWRGKLPFKVDYVDHKFGYLKEPYAGSNAIHSDWKAALKGWWISNFGNKK